MKIEKQDWVVVYEANEDHVEEAQTIRCLFKVHDIRTSYSYKMNKSNFSVTFHKYKPGTLIIKVPQKDENTAKEALLRFHILQRQKEHSIINDI